MQQDKMNEKHDAYTKFADNPRHRDRILEAMMEDGRTTNSHAADLLARIYKAGFNIVPRGDDLSLAIAKHGQIPHMTQKP